MNPAKRLKVRHDPHMSRRSGPRPEVECQVRRLPYEIRTALQTSPHTSPYSAIESEKGDIRLLEIEPGHFDDGLVIELIPSNLLHSSGRSFEALSYVWGTSTCPTKAMLNNVPVEITENLDCALRHLRYRFTPRTLWIDALSMDQGNVQERNHQVQMMGKIYSTAAEVIIWLGPVDQNNRHLRAMLGAMQFYFAVPSPEITTLFDYICSIFSLIDERSTSTTHSNDQLLTVLERILKRPWFERVWVVQELAMSRSAKICMGPYLFPWEPFQRFMRWIPYNRVEPQTHPHIVEAASRVGKAPLGRSFSHHLCHNLHLSATDPRDKIFSLLGMCKFPGVNIVPDYSKSVCMIFSETMAHLMQECNFLIYLYAPLQPLVKDSGLPKLAGLPSWVPDFRFSGAAHALRTHLEDPGVIDAYHRPSNFFRPFSENPEWLLQLMRQNLPFRPVTISQDMKVLTAIGKQIGRVTGVENESNAKYENKRKKFLVDDDQHLLSYHSDTHDGIRCGDVVVGLFGINLPFILRPKANNTYEMVNVAGNKDHDLGHDFLETTRFDLIFKTGEVTHEQYFHFPLGNNAKGDDNGSSWKEYEHHGIQEYTIV